MPSRYKFPSIEPFVNRAIGFIFYFRLIWVTIAIIITGITSYLIWISSTDSEKLKNCAIVFSAGSIIIGIFYSIINYEHNLTKFNHDVKSARDILTFNTACKMHDAGTIGHFRNIDIFYKNNERAFKEHRNMEIQALFVENQEIRVSLIVILNYLEAISIGIEQGIMDEAFMKGFFKTIFIETHQQFNSYIEFLRNDRNSNRIFIKFTTLAHKWKTE